MDDKQNQIDLDTYLNFLNEKYEDPSEVLEQDEIDKLVGLLTGNIDTDHDEDESKKIKKQKENKWSIFMGHNSEEKTLDAFKWIFKEYLETLCHCRYSIKKLKKRILEAKIVPVLDLTDFELRIEQLANDLGYIMVWVEMNPRVYGWRAKGVYFINRRAEILDKNHIIRVVDKKY